MDLEIISSEKVLFKGKVKKVTLPGTLGSFTVLEGHAPLLSTLEAGEVAYNAQEVGKDTVMTIKGGYVEVQNNRVVVCIN